MGVTRGIDLCNRRGYLRGAVSGDCLGMRGSQRVQQQEQQQEPQQEQQQEHIIVTSIMKPASRTT